MKVSYPWKVHQAEFQRPVRVFWHWAVCFEPQSGTEEDAAGTLAFWEKEQKEKNVWHFLIFFWVFGSLDLFAFFAASCQAPSVQCLTHEKKCPRTPTVDGDMEESGVDGPPCILFSQTLVLEFAWFWFLVFLPSQTKKIVTITKYPIFYVSFQTGRMGKKEGFNNKQKKVCHDVWVKDKVDRRPLGVWEVEDLLYTGVVLFKTVFASLVSRAPSLQLKHGDLRLGWFIHENVLKFPGEYLEDTFKPLGYGIQSTVVSPQRFGKPMNRPAWWKSVIWF